MQWNFYPSFLRKKQGEEKMIKMGKHSVCQEDEKKTIKDENDTFSTYAYKNNQQEVTSIPVSK